MKFSKRNSTVVGFAAVSLVVMTMLATTTIVAPILQAKAQAQGEGPPGVHIGNPNDFFVGPPIASCTAVPFAGQGHNDQADGCKVTGQDAKLP